VISSDAGYADAVEEVYAAVDSGNQSTIRAAIDALEFRFPEAPESIASRLDRTSKRAGAEAALAEATQLPKNLFEEPVVQAEIAAIKYRGGDVQAALSAIEAALLQAPDHRGLLRSAAAIFRRANKTDRQAEILKHYIDIRPYDPWGHDEWAKHLLKKRAWGELRGFLRTVPFAYERSYRYKLLLAQMAMSEEDVEGCETHARAAYQLAPGSPKAASTLAFALFYLGRYDEAEILANEAVVIEPTNRSSRETLAKIARLRGDASDIKENPMPYTVDTAANFADINRFGEALDLMSKDDPSEYTAAMLALEATTSQTLLRLGTMRTRLENRPGRRRGVPKLHKAACQIDGEPF
jgi:predicted Zn-dependent protease